MGRLGLGFGACEPIIEGIVKKSIQVLYYIKNGGWGCTQNTL